MVQSEELSSVLWDRIKHHVKSIDIIDDPHTVHIHGVSTLLKGTWEPYGLNKVSQCSYSRIVGFAY